MKTEGLVHAVLCFPIDESKEKVLLGRKTRVIGVGLYNGPGGGIEEHETVDQATVREVRQETGLVIDPAALEPRAVVYCHNFKKDGTPFDCKIFVSVARRSSGELRANGELDGLEWFPLRHPPISRMMIGDRAWVPRVLRGQTLNAEVWYKPNMQELAKPTRVEPRSAEELFLSWISP